MLALIHFLLWSLCGIFVFSVFIGMILSGHPNRRIRHGKLPPRKTIHVGSPTNLQFTDDGRILDKNGNELKPLPFKKWIKGVKK